MGNIAIVGSGPAASVAAIACARAGLPTWQFADSTQASIGEVLAPGGENLLRELKIDIDFPQNHLPCFGTRSSWGHDNLIDSDYLFHEQGRAWHLDRPKFDEQLRQVAIRSGVNLVPTRVKVDRSADAYSVTGSDISFDQVIAANGRRLSLGKPLRYPRTANSRLVSVWATWLTEQDQDRTTLVVARPNGWWYSAPIAANRRVTAWHTDADLVGNAATVAGYQEELLTAARVANKLTVVSGQMETASLRVASAATSWVEDCAGSDWLICGDAAVAYDPISSQGILSAILMGWQAGSTLVAEQQGDTYARERYRQWVRTWLSHHLSELDEVYRSEIRWPESAFWQRRQPDRLSAVNDVERSAEHHI